MQTVWGCSMGLALIVRRRSICRGHVQVLLRTFMGIRTTYEREFGDVTEFVRQDSYRRGPH